nr:protein ALP1-like [Ziziphus jujuba var. spinosa]
MYVAWQRRNERRVRNRITRNTELRTSFIDSLLDNDVTCISQLRMDRRTFVILCRLLRQDGYVKRDGTVTLEEQVCIFLHIIAHHTKNRTIISRFYRSGETISRYFNSVLNGVLRLHSILLRHPKPVSDNCSDDRWKMFKNCLGALDGTYIKVKVPEIDKPRYRTRNGEIATNVLGVCNPNMEFIFVLPGWEGSASDSRVLRNAISRPNGLKVPTAMEAGGSNNDNRWGESRRTWSRGEEEALLVLLDEAVASGQRCDTGAFKPVRQVGEV